MSIFAGLKRGKTSQMDIRKLYETYLRLERSYSRNTIEAYLADAEIFFQWAEARALDVRRLTGPEIEAFVAELAELGVAPRSLARMLSTLRSLYRFLTLEGFTEENPMELVRNPAAGRRLPEVLTPDEVERLLAAIDLSLPEGRRDRAMLEVMYSCGLRVSEVCALERHHVNLGERYLRIVGKGAKTRLVPLSERAGAELALWLEERAGLEAGGADRDVVFISHRRRRRLSRITVFHNLQLYARLAGIGKRISPHTLRHSFATSLLAGGASLPAIQAMLGHESISTTEIYMHVDRSALRRQVDEHFPRNAVYGPAGDTGLLPESDTENE